MIDAVISGSLNLEKLEGTAQEVPVQDQSINNDLVDTIVEKISIKIASALKQLRK